MPETRRAGDWTASGTLPSMFSFLLTLGKMAVDMCDGVA